MKPTVKSFSVVLAIVLAAAYPATAGGPSPDQRNATLGICPQTDASPSEMCTLTDTTLVCDTEPTMSCGVTVAFEATVVFTVNDDPPCDSDQNLACGVANPDTSCPDLTSTKGTTTVTVSGRSRKKKTLSKGGKPFSFSQTFSSCSFPGSFCEAVPCDVTFTPFCCFPVRMTEKSLPSASDLIYRPLTPLADQLRSVYGVTGTPVVVSASQDSSTDHSGPTDALPSSVQFSVVLGFI